MSIRLLKSLKFSLAYLVAILLYLPSLKGTPIWDDFTFWFGDEAMKPGMSYLTIWSNFAWPVSVSIQKLLYTWWNETFLNYHVFNLLLHLANSFLVYRLGRHLQLKHGFMYFLLFLFHPVAVISTAWMIQVKTLLCFFFGLLSLLTFFRGMKETKWMFSSWIFFFLSIASKSASLVLAPILLFIAFRFYRFKKLHLIVPYLILAAWSSYRVFVSPVTVEATAKVEKSISLKIVEKAPEPKVEPKPEPKPEVKPVEKPMVVETKVKVKKKKKKESAPPVVKAPEPEPVVKPETTKTPSIPQGMPKVQAGEQLSAESLPERKPSRFRFDGLILQTLNYYFWQGILPISNHPVKGLNYSEAGLVEVIHLFFLFILGVILFRDSAFLYLICLHVMLLPFLGIVPAPFMTITWVSDQHLYLVLPVMLAMWMRIFERIKYRYNWVIPGFLLLLFTFKTYEAVPTYKDQFTFYEKSLEYNPYNIPIAYNLAYARIVNGQWMLAYNVLVDTQALAQEEPVMKNNQFYVYFFDLYTRVTKVVEKYAL